MEGRRRQAVNIWELDIYSASDILVNVEKERCITIYGVPAMFISLLEQKNFDNFSLFSQHRGYHGRFALPCQKPWWK